MKNENKNIDPASHIPKTKDAEVIFENDHFIALNKPSGMLSIPDREQSEPFTVHRLDRETSGVILFAKDESTHKYLSREFEERRVEKFYVALVHGAVQNKTGTIDAAIMEHPVFKGRMVINKNGKPSVTDYEVMEDFGRYSLVKFQIHTGRTHQVRVHAKNIGHPLVCDPLYGDGKPVLLSSIKKKFKLSKHDEEERPMLNRVALHSYQIRFNDATGHPFDLVADLPKDMTALLQQLRKHL